MAGLHHPFSFWISSYSREKEFSPDQLTLSIVLTSFPLPGFCVHAALMGKQKADTLVAIRHVPWPFLKSDFCNKKKNCIHLTEINSCFYVEKFLFFLRSPTKQNRTAQLFYLLFQLVNNAVLSPAFLAFILVNKALQPAI